MGGLVLTLATLLLMAQASVSAAASDKNESRTRSLSGQVLGHEDAALPDAIVYLKNTKTLAVHTFISDKDGKYQFHGLAPNVDYEVFAQYKDKKSDTKTLSSFDSRTNAYINLKIDVAK